MGTIATEEFNMKVNRFNIISIDLATGQERIIKTDVIPADRDYELSEARRNAEYFETITFEVYEVEV